MEVAGSTGAFFRLGTIAFILPNKALRGLGFLGGLGFEASLIELLNLKWKVFLGGGGRYQSFHGNWSSQIH